MRTLYPIETPESIDEWRLRGLDGIDLSAWREGQALRLLDAMRPARRRFGESNHARMSSFKLRPSVKVGAR